MGSGGKIYSIADAQEFVRRGLATQAAVDAITGRKDPGADLATKLRAAKQPNKTEAEFGRFLEALKRREEIEEYRYEGITLKWADMRYTPDWVVFPAAPKTPFKIGMTVAELEEIWIRRVITGVNPPPTSPWWRMTLIEVKGGHIWDRDIVRFKGARAAWPMFTFEMHQKKGGEWLRIH